LLDGTIKRARGIIAVRGRLFLLAVAFSFFLFSWLHFSFLDRDLIVRILDIHPFPLFAPLVRKVVPCFRPKCEREFVVRRGGWTASFELQPHLSSLN
jgi:hypothetical protein